MMLFLASQENARRMDIEERRKEREADLEERRKDREVKIFYLFLFFYFIVLFYTGESHFGNGTIRCVETK